MQDKIFFASLFFLLRPMYLCMLYGAVPMRQRLYTHGLPGSLSVLPLGR